MSEDLIEKVRYEADITDIQAKLRTLADKQDGLVKETDGHVGKMRKSWGGLKSTLSGAGGWFAGIAGGMSLVALKNLADQGNKLDALDKKAQTVFSGSSLSGVQKWASGVAGSFGITTSEAVAMAAGMGDLFKPMGFTSDQAAAMSTQLGDLSGALSPHHGREHCDLARADGQGSG